MRIVIFCFLLSMSVSAKDLFLHSSLGIQKIVIIKKANKRFNKLCEESGFKCDAYKALDIKSNIVATGKFLGHPASKVCKSVGGHSIILKDKKKNEYDFCLFKDKSMINSWDLMEHLKK